MKNMVYETPVDSEEDLLARVMLRWMLGYKVLVIVSKSTQYARTVYVLKSLVVTSSSYCMWIQNNNNNIQ